ncbi:glucoamylase family protein [Chthonobacter albigriseus]|uniref:glucoamylase family protein n=1 Tax=Chthonobacter albigriseus TaxID=1683161 RepID=UPI0019D54FEF|nr:glucoamylase family protein [Chthonobacter albigriseus]
MTASLSDDALLDLIQGRTLDYFTAFAHPVSGMARERSAGAFGYSALETVTTGGTGFGVMALIAGAERGFISRDAAVAQIARIVGFLETADRFHGVYPHFLDGSTGRTIPFSPLDDGGDLVETSFLMAGLLAAREWVRSGEPNLAASIDALWRAVEWSHHLRADGALLWHWSPVHGTAMNHAVRGWNECLITHVLAASSPTFPVAPETYHGSWATAPEFRNGKSYDGVVLPLGPDGGGPLFFAHYSFMGLDPRGLVDRYADYFEQNRAHALVNHAHCRRNPNGFAGYDEHCWGLTASDNHEGYNAHSPTNDHGVITPTAALASFPYVPDLSMKAARHFHDRLGSTLFGTYGFLDAFNQGRDWVATSHLAIDQGPIVVMIENHRSGLLWSLFMRAPEVLRGLRRLGFASPHLESTAIA